jgi:hypothetical protein
MQRMPILSESDMSLFELKTRYVRNYLTFAGKNSKDYLLYISGPGVYDSPAVDVELQAIPGKNGDLIRDNAKAGEHRFKNLDITYDAFFFDGLAPDSIREELAAFTGRLSGAPRHLRSGFLPDGLSARRRSPLSRKEVKGRL